MWRRIREQPSREAVEEQLLAAEDRLDEGDAQAALRLVERAIRHARALPDGESLVTTGHIIRAAALIELARFKDALAAADEACRGDPSQAATHHERGMALYRLGKFEDALAAFRTATELAPKEAEAWHGLGRCGIWVDDRDLAHQAFRRAAALDPQEYAVPVRIAAGEFDRIALDAWRSVPGHFRALLDNALVTVEPLPDREDVEHGFDPDTLGVYEGGSALHIGDFPERIVLFQRNHENVCSSLGQLREEIRRTILHEVGHHFGMDEAEMPY
jgi:predicted Zn-dependent protease with MMP-like domain